MPIYEYRREDGSVFEVVQKFSDATLTEDPETGRPITRVFRAPAIHFKGSGFHNTDYGTRKRGKDDSDGGGESKGEAKSESSGDKGDKGGDAKSSSAKETSTSSSGGGSSSSASSSSGSGSSSDSG